jgi:hypothetical protein
MAPISVGELVDKITILQIKQQRITDANKRKNIDLELDELEKIFTAANVPDVAEPMERLRTVNNELWDIEDFKRDCERRWTFDDRFKLAARQVYLKNDLRAQIKREINTICGSTIVEEKSYANV